MAYRMLPVTNSRGEDKQIPVTTLLWNNFSEREDAPDLLVLTDTNADVDRPFTVRQQVQRIPNIYKGTNVDTSVFPASKAGIRVYAGYDGILSYQDPEDPSKPRFDFPVHAHSIFQLPLSAQLTSADYEQMLKDCVGLLYANGLVRLSAMIRGALDPRDN